MAVTIGVKTNVDQIAKSIGKLGDSQVPFATSLAMNRTGELARKTLVTTMKSVFDRPTPFVLNSTFVKNSTKNRLQITIGHKELNGKGRPSSAYLQAEIEGGIRKRRASEHALNNYYVPSRNMPLDQYGNIPGGQIKKLLSELGLSENSSGFTSNRSTNSAARQKRKGTFRDVFVMQPNNPRGLKPGVYQRIYSATKTRYSALAGRNVAIQGPTTLKPLLFFVSTPQYNKRYDFEGVIQRVWDAEYGRQFAAAMDYALSTAKFKVNAV